MQGGVRLKSIFDEDAFYNAVSKLSHTEYGFNPKQDQAPAITNCVTYVRFIVNKSTGFTIPKDWVGNIGRELIYSGNGGLIETSRYELGDIIFMQGKGGKSGITHVGIFGGDNLGILNSSYKLKGANNILINDINKSIFRIFGNEEIVLNYDKRTGKIPTPGKGMRRPNEIT